MKQQKGYGKEAARKIEDVINVCNTILIGCIILINYNPF